MTLLELITNASSEKREESEIIKTTYKDKQTIIKKPNDFASALKEVEIVGFLNNKGFNTYRIINNEIVDSDGYVIYEYIDGIDGFSYLRDSTYFYNAGKIIGLMHSYLNEYSLIKNENITYIHGDLHSGNIIVNKNNFYIIDFSTIRKDWQFIDLLNIEYELCYEEDCELKRSKFIEGYLQYSEIKYPNKAYVINNIMESDLDEYNRWEKRGWKISKYHNHLKYSVKNKQPTFIPIWLGNV